VDGLEIVACAIPDCRGEVAYVHPGEGQAFCLDHALTIAFHFEDRMSVAERIPRHIAAFAPMLEPVASKRPRGRPRGDSRMTLGFLVKLLDAWNELVNERTSNGLSGRPTQQQLVDRLGVYLGVSTPHALVKLLRRHGYEWEDLPDKANDTYRQFLTSWEFVNEYGAARRRQGPLAVGLACLPEILTSLSRNADDG
jgi:hypothetical protein